MARFVFAGLWLASQAVAFTVPTPVLKAVTTTAPGYSACVTANAFIDYCSSNIPDFDNAPATKIAHCLCCSSTAYMPGVFDGAAATCASYIHTALPSSTSAYTIFSELASFCVVEGNVCGGGSVIATSSRAVVTTTAAGSVASSTTSKAKSSSAAKTGQGSGSTISSPTSTAATTKPAATTVTVDGGSPTTTASRAAVSSLNGKDSLVIGVIAPLVAMLVL